MSIKLKISSGDYSAEVEAGKTATVKCNGKKLAEDIVFEAVEVADYTEAANSYGTTVIINSFTEAANSYGTTVTI